MPSVCQACAKRSGKETASGHCLQKWGTLWTHVDFLPILCGIPVPDPVPNILLPVNTVNIEVFCMLLLAQWHCHRCDSRVYRSRLQLPDPRAGQRALAQACSKLVLIALRWGSRRQPVWHHTIHDPLLTLRALGLVLATCTVCSVGYTLCDYAGDVPDYGPGLQLSLSIAPRYSWHHPFRALGSVGIIIRQRASRQRAIRASTRMV